MVIDVLHTLHRGHEPVVYFYCNRNDPSRRDPTILLQALVKQLALVLPGLPKSVLAVYDKREERGFAAGALEFQESCDLIVMLLGIYPQTTIVIDALDESYPEERWRLLEALRTLIASSTSLVKIFVSSRDDIDIKLELEHVPNLHINAMDNMEDIERFVHREVGRGRLLRGNLSEELRSEIITTIVGKANGM